ncbi:MAG: hypothetical protein KAY24_01840 [Candidatus Eisenbacteria sp.]|nr:hypothetical protein [Candidatus Eisenbacteria bacterium]
MNRSPIVWGGLLAAATILMQGCSAGFLGMGGASLRHTNVEVQLISQSCFQGELVPCG